HESRRIDNQLRGRSGRQGDPGLSKFYVSLEDDLMRIFGSERIGRILKTMGLKEGQSIVHPWISKAIAKAQQKVESFHFDVRKNLLKYDDVMNEQRKIIYDQRRQLLERDSVHDIIADMRRDAFESVVYSLAPERSVSEDWNAESLRQEILQLANIDAPFDSWKNESGITPEDMVDRLCKMSEEIQSKKWAELPENARNELERSLLVQSVDQLWKEHLQSLDFMKTSIGLRAYGQKNPLNEYKHDAFILFQNMLGRIRERVCQVIGFSELRLKQTEQTEMASDTDISEEKDQPLSTAEENISRNAPCPCGSGKKYKHCCGRLG
ncbi:MAG: SEC-C domain-containing protein, partial [Alphaproteobacteria bacterium]|nr:SEC-C domain-containing protein [Alphaproteobacteria bacterium]